VNFERRKMELDWGNFWKTGMVKIVGELGLGGLFWTQEKFG